MAEYIKREAAAQILRKEAANHYPTPFHVGLLAAARVIEAIPAADVRPVVRGKWEVGGMFDDIGRCSCCNYMFPLDTAMTEFHFCPNCGADMREKS